MWKDFFYFSRRERQGIVILIVLIAGVFLGKFLFTPKNSNSTESGIELSKNNESQEIIPEKANEQAVKSPFPAANQKNYNAPAKTNQQPEKRSYYPQTVESRASPKQNQYPVTEKFEAGIVIDINTSDTLQLMKIPGI